jgi:hypothetical protein
MLCSKNSCRLLKQVKGNVVLVTLNVFEALDSQMNIHFVIIEEISWQRFNLPACLPACVNIEIFEIDHHPQSAV